jgi:hypothetical protein
MNKNILKLMDARRRKPYKRYSVVIEKMNST